MKVRSILLAAVLVLYSCSSSNLAHEHGKMIVVRMFKNKVLTPVVNDSVSLKVFKL